MSSKPLNPGMLLAAMVRSGPAATRLTRIPCGPRYAGQIPGSTTPGRPWPRPSSRRRARPRDASKSRPTIEPPPGHQRQRRHGQRLEGIGGHLHRGGHVRPLGVQEVAAQRRLRGVRRCRAPRRPAPSTCSPDPLGQRVELIRVGHVQLDHRRRLRQPLGDPLHQAEPAEPGEHHRRALLLRDPGHVERDRGVGEHPGDQDPLAVQDSHLALSAPGPLSGPCPGRRPPG